jgi:hypothetical protein
MGQPVSARSSASGGSCRPLFAVSRHKRGQVNFANYRKHPGSGRQDVAKDFIRLDMPSTLLYNTMVPHLAVVAFTVIAIILILIFVRFRFELRFAKVVCLTLDALIVVFLIGLIFICFQFSTR